ncbi:uncharacterized protein LOC110726967 [Chenopodium quinoa]|uniref:uncharacterized protein LOC110726967 n=1 Tax=Chenopodium quinoa TaxID=63459 RepID=UPI000B76FCF3|nr:uncharacterized protein LOC110726967 [Chenopodium quinoa]
MADGKDTGKRRMQTDDFDDDMEDAYNLDNTQEPTSSSSRGQTQERSQLPVLDPTVLWFDDDKVKTAVSGAITGYYRQPWRNYNEVDAATKEHWWNLFCKEFTWAPQLTEDVKHTFEKRLATRLRDMFYTVTHKMRGARPAWLIEDVHKKMMDIVAADPTFKARSSQNKKNRRGGSMESPVEATHYQGSMSVVQHAKRMATKNKGQLPTSHELFMKTHFKEVPGKGTEAYQKKVAEASTQGIQKSPNELYWETVGGRNKKGRVKGLGQGAELYYGSRKSSKSSQQYTPSFLSQMQDQMDQRLEERMQAMRSEMEVELETRLAEIERRNQERYEEMMRRFSSNYSCSNIPHQRRDPTNDDPGSGGAGIGTPNVA